MRGVGGLDLLFHSSGGGHDIRLVDELLDEVDRGLDGVGSRWCIVLLPLIAGDT